MSVGPLTPSQFERFRQEIRQKESSNKYSAENQLGYVGAYQFGAAALVDLGYVDSEAYRRAVQSGNFSQKQFLDNDNNWKIPGGKQAFFNDNALQDRLFEEYTRTNYNRLQNTGALNAGSSPTQVAGLLAVSHLLGSGGRTRDGKLVGATAFQQLREGSASADEVSGLSDANGTSASDYFEIGVKSIDRASSFSSAEFQQSQQSRLDAVANAQTTNGTVDTQAVTNPQNQNLSQAAQQQSGERVDTFNSPSQEDITKSISTATAAKKNNTDADENSSRDILQSETPITVNMSSAGPGSVFEKQKSLEINSRPNPLTEFATYTYNIALYMMKADEFVRTISTSDENLTIENIKNNSFLLMRSGSVGSKNRTPYFDTDFFIDDLEITTISASPTRLSANTNATEIKFKITEPNGVTLLQRLYELSKTPGVLSPNENHLHTPYLLEISFKGYDDNGQVMNNFIKPKYIPIKLTDFKFEVQVTGTEYTVEAIPYAQQLFSNIRQTIPINIQITADTVGKIFDTETKEFKIIGDFNENGKIDNDERITTGTTAKTLAESLTNFYKSLTKPRYIGGFEGGETIQPDSKLYDEYEFVIADKIKRAKLVREDFDPLNTNLETSKLFDHYASLVQGKINIDAAANLFRINAGTGIVNLINFIIISSEYVEDSLISERIIDDDVVENKPIQWFKVIPTISEIKGWDEIASRYAYKIKYNVIPYEIYYNDFPFVKRSKPVGKGYHKEYNYLFTGKNTEVLEFKMNFDLAYYQAHTVGTGTPLGYTVPSATQLPVQKKLGSESIEGQIMDNSSTPARKRSKDLMSNIMNDGADLLDLDMSIAGDPDYIPSGDLFMQQALARGRIVEDAFHRDGTINYDVSPPYIKMIFKTPNDYDDYTGKVDITNTGLFEGIYQITEIVHSFSGGAFTQKLKGFKTKVQPDDAVQTKPRENITISTINNDGTVLLQTLNSAGDIVESNVQAITQTGIDQSVDSFDTDPNE